MARPRKPTAILELVGAFKHDPSRRRDNEPVSDGEVGSAPDRLSDKQVEAWDYLVASCAAGVLTQMDRAYLELTAIMLARVWMWNGWCGQDSAVREDNETIFAPDLGTLIKDTGAMLGKLGMNPSERSRVVVAKKDKPNPFARYGKA